MAKPMDQCEECNGTGIYRPPYGDASGQWDMDCGDCEGVGEWASANRDDDACQED